MKLPTIREEAEAIEKGGNIYIPPYRMAEILKVAQKIMNILAAPGNIAMSYAECDVILEIVIQATKRGRCL